MTADQILNWLYTVVPSVLVALGSFKWLGQKWVDQRLAIKLEKFKSENQTELERLRHLLSSRVSRIHEKEFEILPKAWLKLHEAQGSAAQALIRLNNDYPDFAQLPEPQFEEFLTTSRLSEFHKQILRSNPAGRQKYFDEAMAAIEFSEAWEKQRTFHNYLIEHSIFMTDELRKKFREVDNDLSGALNEHKIGKESNDRTLQRSAMETVTHLKGKIDEVERAVQVRLRYEEA